MQIETLKTNNTYIFLLAALTMFPYTILTPHFSALI